MVKKNYESNSSIEDSKEEKNSSDSASVNQPNPRDKIMTEIEALDENQGLAQSSRLKRIVNSSNLSQPIPGVVMPLAPIPLVREKPIQVNRKKPIDFSETDNYPFGGDPLGKQIKNKRIDSVDSLSITGNTKMELGIYGQDIDISKLNGDRTIDKSKNRKNIS